MPENAPIDPCQALSAEERALADKARLAMMAPAFRRSYEQSAPNREARAARLAGLLAKPEPERTVREREELEQLIHHDIMVLGGVLGEDPAAKSAGDRAPTETQP